MFYKKRCRVIKYATLYVHEKYGLAEQRWHTIVTIKDLILIDNGLPNNFRAKAMERADYF